MDVNFECSMERSVGKLANSPDASKNKSPGIIWVCKVLINGSVVFNSDHLEHSTQNQSSPWKYQIYGLTPRNSILSGIYVRSTKQCRQCREIRPFSVPVYSPPQKVCNKEKFRGETKSSRGLLTKMETNERILLNFKFNTEVYLSSIKAGSPKLYAELVQLE